MGAELYQQLSGSLDPADGAKTSRPLSLDGVRWTTTGVAWPIQRLQGTAARRDNFLQALSAALHVSGALVAMTWCATRTGDTHVGAGLLGLSRAWMMAGARAVVAFQVTGGGR